MSALPSFVGMARFVDQADQALRLYANPKHWRPVVDEAGLPHRVFVAPGVGDGCDPAREALQLKSHGPSGWDAMLGVLEREKLSWEQATQERRIAGLGPQAREAEAVAGALRDIIQWCERLRS